jgi:hypothetical protein
MAEAYYSTEASVQKKVNALRIQRWLDDTGSGSIDEDAFNSARQEAKDEILSYVQQRIGSTVTDLWDTDTRPDWIGAISDWLTLYHSLYGNNADHPVALRRYDENIDRLERIRTNKAVIPGTAFSSGQTNEATTARIEDDDYNYEISYDYDYNPYET